MKRVSILVVLLSLVLGAVLTGCEKSEEAPKPPDAGAATNAVPPAPAPPAPK